MPGVSPQTDREGGGATWHHTYDERGNLLTSTDPAGAETRYAYDATGHLSAITDALGSTRNSTCNPAGLPVSLTDSAGATTHVERDAFGRIVTITDPLGRTTHMGWTSEGKPAWREEPDGARETWNWDPEGNLLAHTDPAGNTTRTTTGPFDLPVSRTDSDGTTYAFAYDTEMRLTEVTNPLGWKWTYAYGPAGRLTSETDFNGRTVAYERDAAGQLTARTNGAGETVRFTHDALGRTLRQGASTTFEYDVAGHLIRATSPDATVEWQRDPMGRVLAESTNGRTVSYGYDALGHRIRRTTPSGTTSTWTFDPVGRPAALDTSHGALAFTYDAAGRETERRLGPGLALTQTWDAADRLTSQTITTRGQRILQHRAYVYRIDGHLQEIRDLASGTQLLALDRAGRITGVRAHGWTENYAYDAAGNLTSATAPGDDFPTGDRAFSGTLIASAGRTAYEHDAQGRLTRKTRRLLSGQARSWTYEWTPEDRLAGVITPDGHQWRYCYDPLGRRTAKRRLAPDGSVAEEVTYSWDATTLAEQTGSDGTTVTWDCSPETHAPITQTTQDAHGARFHAIVTDLVGTPTELVSPDGETAWQRRTSLWGAPLPAPDPKAQNVSCPLRFAGQYQDDETGLHYNYYRYYDPETARYISPDPLGLEPAPNHHGYVSNPLQATDALGLKGSKLCRVDVTWGGRVNYGELDSLGRPTRMTAKIERDMLDEGTDAKRSIRPPGFKGGMPIGNHARGHLLANRLGGSGDIPENLVTLVQDPVNTPIMRGFESQVYGAVAKGETVNYSVTPVYDGYGSCR
ncbi:RHS repeat-associated core domain-containing protein [Streptomyces sp. TRM68367]|uniref:RHS repeat-associated core domain-containing protein n=1 Tax=Streptomyces sp. TRM68367 TaxID=2758415 RepID=UPI002934940A|nr:RHS repeat-associated core domain-containing protein [Streptomyces sp. TRM68367]